MKTFQAKFSNGSMIKVPAEDREKARTPGTPIRDQPDSVQCDRDQGKENTEKEMTQKFWKWLLHTLGLRDH